MALLGKLTHGSIVVAMFFVLAAAGDLAGAGPGWHHIANRLCMEEWIDPCSTPGEGGAHG